MGNGESQHERLEVPELYYMYRKKSTVLHIANGVITKLKFSKKLKIREDSAIGYMPSRKMMICGGTDSSGCLTNKVYIVDPIKLTTKLASVLPAPCKKGYLFQFWDWIYYAGGISESQIDDEEDEAPARLMRYHIRENRWETLGNEKKPEKVHKHVENHKEEAKDPKKKSTPGLQDLFLPVVFMFSCKLYFVGGEIKSAKGKLRQNNRVYSIDLNGEDYSLKKENFALPEKLQKPLCVNRGSDVLITGGFIGKEVNKACWSLSFVQNKAEFTQEPEYISDFVDKHPAIYDGNFTILFAFPEVMFLKNKAKNWEKFTIIQKKDKPPTPALNKVIQVVEKQAKKKTEVGKKIEKNAKKKEKVRKKDSNSDSEEEKINPFPTLESMRKSKTSGAFEARNES